MATPLLLVDSDVFALLSSVGLLGDLIAELGVAETDVRRLPALLTQLRPDKSIGRKFRDLESARQNAIRQTDATVPLTARPHDENMRMRLEATAEIDPGEGLLMVLLAENPGWLLTDRR